MAPRHLVLGGSSGIGFAYAKWHAHKGHAISLVARGSDTLDIAQRRLLESGASDVDVVAGDLRDHSFRSTLFGKRDSSEYASIFAGGPSPHAGPISGVSPESILSDAAICLAYPCHVIRWLRETSHSADRPTLILLSSSAATEDINNHPFFASALLRRSLDVFAIQHIAAFPDLAISIWRPRVVLTALSKRYAITHNSGAGSDDVALRNTLCLLFNVADIPSADDFVRQMLTEVF